MHKHPRFLDMYHAGVVQAAEIEDYIEQWHRGGSHVSLHVFLGLTWAEYSMWATLGTLPTEKAHQQLTGRQDMAFVGPPEDRQPLAVHGPIRCRPACPIHWPSDHAMADWPLAWYEDIGVIMRLCHHGFGHPDPDDQQVRLHPDLAEHGCDGCCRPALDGDFYEEDEPVRHVLDAFAQGRKGITARPS
jgi:hypothetical protein